MWKPKPAPVHPLAHSFLGLLDTKHRPTQALGAKSRGHTHPQQPCARPACPEGRKGATMFYTLAPQSGAQGSSRFVKVWLNC